MRGWSKSHRPSKCDGYARRSVTAAQDPGPPIHEETTQPKRKSERVTEQLLDAATAVFGERGFEAATVSEVARRCGMTSGAVYARWLSKHELFEAVVEHASAQRMLLLIKSVDATPAEKLALLGTNLLNTGRDDTRNLWIEACVSASREGTSDAAIVHAQEVEARELVEIVDAGKEAGLIDPSLSTAAIVLLCQSLGLGSFLALRVQSPERPQPDDDEWAALVARLISAIGPIT
ncbi:MAG: TetR/AcrR family transcriptional regulator [Acidimicrobiales bacterium]|nr:TetR/AcrR family transcriptional regulator [Acidimicrobiales bacterium]MYD84649.1 TetR/AcrR family transcriptional regulator [Acidimicrobiales bacterium]MYJ64598.1 TetR/AcrR family transcriptional regulator [Acidimicrobiales bacterium]